MTGTTASRMNRIRGVAAAGMRGWRNRRLSVVALRPSILVVIVTSPLVSPRVPAASILPLLVGIIASILPAFAASSASASTFATASSFRVGATIKLVTGRGARVAASWMFAKALRALMALRGVDGANEVTSSSAVALASLISTA